MQTFVFSIFDTKAKLYGQPFFSKNQATAVREFSLAVNGTGMMSEYPEDFTLYCVGNFNFDSGALIPADPESITQGIHLVHTDPTARAPFEMTNGATQWGTPPPEIKAAAQKELDKRQLEFNVTHDTTPTNSGGSNR